MEIMGNYGNLFPKKLNIMTIEDLETNTRNLS